MSSERVHQYDSLKAALSAAQAEIPAVKKDKTAHVQPKDGRAYKYSYADLYDMFAVGMPWLAKFGLGFTSKPTINQDGKFVLQYQLFHGATQQEEAGEYSLPTSGTPQSVGAAITYAKRQVFSALTGIVADEDNDAHDGQASDTGYQRQRPSQQRNGQQPNGQTDAPPPRTDPVEKAKAHLRELLAARKLDPTEVASRYEQQYGETLKQATDPTRVQAFTKLVEGEPAGAPS